MPRKREHKQDSTDKDERKAQREEEKKKQDDEKKKDAERLEKIKQASAAFDKLYFSNEVGVLFMKTFCRFSQKAELELTTAGVKFKTVILDTDSTTQYALHKYINPKSEVEHKMYVPQYFRWDKKDKKHVYVGGSDKVHEWLVKQSLLKE